jgi:2'-5' RNA ligase
MSLTYLQALHLLVQIFTYWNTSFMKAIRTFVAIRFPPEVQENLGQALESMHAGEIKIVRWVDASRMHLTLKFIGEVDPARITPIRSQVEESCRQVGPFDIQLGGLGVFPNMTKPRIVWVGVQAPPQLFDLQKDIEARLSKIGYAPEERGFSAHITLGRLRDEFRPAEMERLVEVLQTTKMEQVARFTAAAVTIYRSDLQPFGPMYTPLATLPLTGTPSSGNVIS